MNDKNKLVITTVAIAIALIAVVMMVHDEFRGMGLSGVRGLLGVGAVTGMIGFY